MGAMWAVRLCSHSQGLPDGHRRILHLPIEQPLTIAKVHWHPLQKAPSH